MNGRVIKKIKQEIRRAEARQLVKAYNSLCALPFGQRVKWAWGILVGKGV